MIKFTNTEKYLKKYSIDIRGEEYPIKIPTLKEWLIINSIDFSDLNKIREIATKVINIMIKKLTLAHIDKLSNIELVQITIECLKILSRKDSDNEIENNTSSNEEEILINFDYLLAKYCKYYNTSLEKTLNTNVFIFFDLLNAIEILIAEESLRLSEIFDNHLNLKVKNGNVEYKKVLEKYRDTFKRGVKVKAGPDLDGLLKLKQMLGGK